MKNEKKPNKELSIVVNGREKTVSGKTISSDELVELAFDNPPTGEFICFTITYRKGHGNKPDGNLAEGEMVKVKKGMIFNVTATDKS
ncbi:multiubiquitin domain-containing protein [Maricaulis alexandrii]|uniref:multiubiquitin domain-containing protein n=1 Tax=Maricaulis alexandrii TaxID=2570354 RepID=UPI001109D6BB|nr:multiubiquitin domain-containing protein [Maricaulis alexandrii]MCR9118427.1 multiubiquitin domain-containing protein [bacterium]|tara:strand:+ start:412 stop:672 length:261 start_codon:yes stop_codon:yes gene_type:complete